MMITTPTDKALGRSFRDHVWKPRVSPHLCGFISILKKAEDQLFSLISIAKSVVLCAFFVFVQALAVSIELQYQEQTRPYVKIMLAFLFVLSQKTKCTYSKVEYGQS